MTANNLIASKKHNCIWIATDAAHYRDNGVVSEFRSKVHTVSAWPAVITGRGNSFALDTVARELPRRASNFEEMVGITYRELPLIIEQFRIDRPFELNLTGFFRGRPMIFFVRTPGDHKVSPFLPLPVGSTHFGPWPSEELIKASGFVEPDPNDEPENIVTGLRTLIELQRRIAADDGFSRVVGGFAELTVIRPDGIDQQILCRWPDDRIGHRVSALEWEN